MIFIMPISVVLVHHLVLFSTVILIAKPASAAVTTLAYVVVVCGYVSSVYPADTPHPF